MSNAQVVNTLKRLAQKHGGKLAPKVVVEVARAPQSPLHDYFTWDDGEAAEQWRLQEARQLLRVTVEFLPENKNKSTHVFVSLTNDRTTGEGYRLLTDVLSDSERRNTLLADALSDLRSFERKYKELQELANVFSAIRRVRIPKNKHAEQRLAA